LKVNIGAPSTTKNPSSPGTTPGTKTYGRLSKKFDNLKIQESNTIIMDSQISQPEDNLEIDFAKLK